MRVPKHVRGLEVWTLGRAGLEECSIQPVVLRNSVALWALSNLTLLDWEAGLQHFHRMDQQYIKDNIHQACLPCFLKRLVSYGFRWTWFLLHIG